jgi:hypothetical protein
MRLNLTDFFRVIHGAAIASAILRTIQHRQMRQIAQRTLIGSIDQFSDSTDSVKSRLHYRYLYLDGG